MSCHHVFLMIHFFNLNSRPTPPLTCLINAILEDGT